MNIVDLVKDRTAKLSYLCNGEAYFIIDSKWQFPIDTTTEEWNNCFLYPEYKAITLMRWIRKAMENNTIVDLTLPE
jgi:hypothetical protein